MGLPTPYMRKYAGQEQEIKEGIERLGLDVASIRLDGPYLIVDLVDFETHPPESVIETLESLYNAEVIVRCPWDEGTQYVTRLLFVSNDLVDR